MNNPKINLPFTLNDRVWTLTHNEVHSHLVSKVKAELSQNALNDRIIQKLVYVLSSDNHGTEIKTCRRDNVPENDLFETKDAAVMAWLKNQNLSKSDAEKIIIEIKRTYGNK